MALKLKLKLNLTRPPPGPAPLVPSGDCADSTFRRGAPTEWDDPKTTRRARAAGGKPKRPVAGRNPLGEPATCERTYSDDEREFLVAMDSYILRTGRKFPTWTEALAVLVGLGWVRSVR